MTVHVFDTSALLAYLRDEEGAQAVHNLLSSKKHTLKMHKINLGEVYYGVLKKEGLEKARQLYGMLLQYPVEYLESVSDALLVTAGNMKIEYNLGFADSFAAATAITERGTLVTKDNDFRPLVKDKILSVLWV